MSDDEVVVLAIMKSLKTWTDKKPNEYFFKCFSRIQWYTLTEKQWERTRAYQRHSTAMNEHDDSGCPFDIKTPHMHGIRPERPAGIPTPKVVVECAQAVELISKENAKLIHEVDGSDVTECMSNEIDPASF